MLLIAKFQKCTEVQSGTSKAGQEWSNITAEFTTIERYPKMVAVRFRGDLIDAVLALKPNDICEINLDAVSRLYEGRYFTDLEGYTLNK